MAITPIIQVNDLKKTYHSTEIPVEALRGINMEIYDGEFTAIVGPSGCGKTTLLNILGGLDDPTSGTVLIDGQDLSGLSGNDKIDFRKEKIGFVFQAYNLIPVLNAEENIEFVMMLQGRSKVERDARVAELLQEVGLEDKGKHRPNQLSGGQQQRVAVARALAPKPKFILADEPTANLDSQSTEHLLSLMKKLNEEENMTFIFSTHDQRVIDKAERIITLEDGQIISDETAN